MFELIGLSTVGIILITIGVFNFKGYIGTLHSYHRKRVTEEDRIPFGRLVGTGMITIGLSLIASGILLYLNEKTTYEIYSTVATVVSIVGLVVGLFISFYAMIKYNKGIF